MDKDNCLYIQNVYSFKSSIILFELKVILVTSLNNYFQTLPLSSFPKLSLGLSHGFFSEITYFFFSFFSVARGTRIILFNMRFLRYRITYYIFIYYKFNQKLFPKIKFILGNNAVEQRGVKSHYFWEDLASFTPYFI